MPSILQSLHEYNRLAAVAQERGVRGVRPLAMWRMSRGAAEARVAALRVRLNMTAAEFGAPVPVGPVALTADAFATATDAVAPVGDFTFGVEIECILPRGVGNYATADRITAAGVPCAVEIYNHSLRGSWKIVTDSSLQSDQGIEVVSPILCGEAGFAELRKVCGALTAIGARVNRRCGLHVHIGAREQDVGFFKRLVTAYAHYEGAIDAFMPASRRGGENRFCQPVRVGRGALERAATVAEVATACGQSSLRPRDERRYRKLNLQSFWQHGTVEFRHHSGTVETDKAENWARFCLAMAAGVRVGRPLTEDRSVDGLLAWIGASEGAVNYFRGRATRFAASTLRSNAA